MIDLRLFGFAAVYAKSWCPRGGFELYPDTQNAHPQRAQQAQPFAAYPPSGVAAAWLGNPEAIQPDGLACRTGDPVRQRGPFYQFHHQVVRAYVVQRADVGMIQRRNAVGFALEPVGKSLGGNLDGDFAIQASVAGPVHLAHSARADGCKDLVRAQARPSG